ncbi:MAG: hypothetical protein H0W49_03085 [Nitrospirales bacterium]|nr:hypothetical protein [Nitrospirales bacterium]
MKQMVSLAFVLILAGCAIGRSYHDADNMWKLGYTDTQLNESVYRVSYAGYSIPQSECDDFAIMRASEIAKEKGYKYFRILTEKQSAHSESFYVPGSTYTTGTVSGYGNFAQMNSTGHSSGIMGTANYPVSTITIEMLKEKGDILDTLDAEIIWNSLAQKHGVDN